MINQQHSLPDKMITNYHNMQTAISLVDKA